MADTKITALTALTAADPINDVIPIVDVSDTTMAASGTTKKISVNNILSSSPTASGALTVTGLVTAGSATITGALTVDTTTLVVDATNDRVGIGTATPTAALSVSLAEVSAAAGTAAIITNTTGGGNRIAALRLNNLSNQWNIRAYGAVTDDLRFGSGSTGSETDYLTVNTSGNVTVSTGNVVMGTSGKGIDFSATSSPSAPSVMTSELLDDYEEGTWTGTLKGSVSNPTVAVTATGKYTKVGRQVTVNINYNNVSTVGASGNVTIDGLPFIGADNFAGSSIAFDLFAISTTLASWNAGTEIEFFITGAYVKATHNPGTGRYLTTTITYNA